MYKQYTLNGSYFYYQKNRINYKLILGRSLTEIITQYRISGKSSNETIKNIWKMLEEKGASDFEIYRKLVNSVNNRFAEQKIYEDRYERQRKISNN